MCSFAETATPCIAVVVVAVPRVGTESVCLPLAEGVLSKVEAMLRFRGLNWCGNFRVGAVGRTKGEYGRPRKTVKIQPRLLQENPDL